MSLCNRCSRLSLRGVGALDWRALMTSNMLHLAATWWPGSGKMSLCRVIGAGGQSLSETMARNDEWQAVRLSVQALQTEYALPAQALAAQLGLEYQTTVADFALQLGEQGLQLVELGPQAPGPVRVDFVEGALAHRRQFGGGAGQMIAKAVGLAPEIGRASCREREEIAVG